MVVALVIDCYGRNKSNAGIRTVRIKRLAERPRDASRGTQDLEFVAVIRDQCHVLAFGPLGSHVSILPQRGGYSESVVERGDVPAEPKDLQISRARVAQSRDHVQH